MKNYEEMSDSQIAQKVFFFVSGSLCPKGGLAHISSDGFFFFDDKNIKRKFDPCNNPADAWPIIDENNITIINDHPSMRLAVNDAAGYYNGFSGIIASFDENGFRAAMIVFLKMNEDKL
jgi:hypothetical protein|nr:MAG TPA: Protein of unknown function (DUF2591) [Caudoviricetes sp.]